MTVEFDDGDVIGILALFLVVAAAVVSVGFGLAVATVRAGRSRSTVDAGDSSAAGHQDRSWPNALVVTATAVLLSAVSGALLDSDARVVVFVFLALSAAFGYLVGRWFADRPVRVRHAITVDAARHQP